MEHEHESIPLENFRIRSLRQRKRRAHLDFDKRLISLYREQRNIDAQQRLLGYEELNPPVQRGWKRLFVLRDDIRRSSDANFFQSILDKINTVTYSWRKDFKVKKRQRGKKIYVVREQELRRLSESCIKKLKFTTEELAYFELARVPDGKPGGGQWLYTFLEPWRFRLKIEPNIIRRTRVMDFDLERRKKEIDQFLKRNHLYSKMHKLVHGSDRWRFKCWSGKIPKYQYHALQNRSFADILDEYMPEENRLQLNVKPSSEGFFLFTRL